MRKKHYAGDTAVALTTAAGSLPPPAALAPREATEKVTIVLSKRSVEFFRHEAKRHGTQYQRMIRALLDSYTSAHAPQARPSRRIRRDILV
jgi:formaldehyde-activating enzyme involved in methanogenesis